MMPHRESVARETCPAMLMITSSPAPDSAWFEAVIAHQSEQAGGVLDNVALIERVVIAVDQFGSYTTTLIFGSVEAKASIRARTVGQSSWPRPQPRSEERRVGKEC